VKSPCLLVSLVVFAATHALAATIYSSLPTPLPSNVAAWGYEANHTAEMGEYIQTAGGELATVTLLLSDWAPYSTYSTNPLYDLNSATWNLPLTLNLFAVDSSSGTPEPGALLGTLTETVAIPWEPAADPQGLPFTVTFDMSAEDIDLAGPVIYGLAFNTQDYGTDPYLVAGPYDSLNLGFVPGGPTVGSDPVAYSSVLDAADDSDYGDNGAGGLNTFRLDPNSQVGSYIASADFETVAPEPGTPALFACGLIALGLLRRRRS
jgi:hypothetical protein